MMALLCAGCFFMVDSRVTRFHALARDEAGKSIAIFPADPSKKNGLEFQRYASVVADQLTTHGYRVVPSEEVSSADYALFFDFAIDQGQQINIPIPVYGQVGGGTTHQSGSFSGYGSGGSYVSGTYSGSSWSPPVVAQIGSFPLLVTHYTRVLQLQIVDRAALQERNEIRPVFEGRVISRGESQLPRVMPAMIRTLFDKFPGRSGETFRTWLPPKN
jgi:hypothetical protein